MKNEARQADRPDGNRASLTGCYPCTSRRYDLAQALSNTIPPIGRCL
jgi:hypothetical protein